MRGDGQQPHLRPEHRRRRNHAAAAVLAGRRRRRLDLQDLHHRRRPGHGHGHQRHSSTRPARFEAKGLGSGGAQGLPAGHLVRAERRQLPRLDERHRRARHLAEHRVRQADLAGRRAARRSTWPSSSACGPTRCPAPPATTTRRATRASPTSSSGRTSGSFTLGPIEVNAAGAVQRRGDAGVRRHVVPAEPDRQGLRPHGQGGVGHHRDLRAGRARGPGQHAGQRDEQGRPGGGTAAGSAGSAGWNLPMSGQDGHHRGAPLVRLPRLHQRTTPPPTTSTTTRPRRRDLCSFPLRQCGSGNLYGGNEPARTWFTAMKPIANDSAT